MSRILCVAVVVSGALLSWAEPTLAGMNEGVAAVTVGDYPRAIAEFEPLAASGDPAAQYQLAKIFLEGRGPADGVPRGIDLMNKAASGNYPEAQAQLGLMYAMGLGVEVDNAKAYDWLSKAVAALPDGTRRTVAEANRDAVMKRMDVSQQAAIAPAPAAGAATTAKAADTKAAATTKAADTKAAATTKPADTKAAPTTKPAATQEAAAKPGADAMAKTTTSSSTTSNSKPAVAKPAATAATSAPTTTSKPASSETAVKTPDSTAQVASAKAPEAAASSSGSAAAPSGVRIQLVSMPSEEAAWSAWKQLSGKYSTQLTGLTAIVQSADLGTKGTFYRVQTGPFETVAAAQERCSAMKEAGLDCLVVGKP